MNIFLYNIEYVLRHDDSSNQRQWAKGELDFIRTKWDYNVDKFSVNPGKQIFEKMISGMYMGELIRQVLVDLMKDDLIFYDCNREKLAQRGKKIDRFCPTFCY